MAYEVCSYTIPEIICVKLLVITRDDERYYSVGAYGETKNYVIYNNDNNIILSTQ